MRPAPLRTRYRVLVSDGSILEIFLSARSQREAETLAKRRFVTDYGSFKRIMSGIVSLTAEPVDPEVAS